MFNYFKLIKKAFFYGLDTRGEDHGNHRFGGGSGSRTSEEITPDPPNPISNTGYSLMSEKEIYVSRNNKKYRLYRKGKFYSCYGLKNRSNSKTVYNVNLFNKYMYENLQKSNLLFWVPVLNRDYFRFSQLDYSKETTFIIPATGTYTLRLNDNSLDTKSNNELITKELQLNAGDIYKLPSVNDGNNINSLVFNLTDNGTARGGKK